MPNFLRRHWFLLLLSAVLVLGLWQGPQLADSVRPLPRGWLVAGVMFLTALPMAFRQLTTAARQVRSVGLALLLSVVAAPLLAWSVGKLLPEALAVGLLVAATVPCTLASAAVWTRRGGGNDAIALLVTLVTNLACFAVMPWWLWFFLRQSVELDAGGLSVRLLWLVVVPIVAAQLVRLNRSVASAASRWKPQLSIAAQVGVLAMVLFGAISAGETLASTSSGELPPLKWALLLLAVLAVHLLLFGLGWWGSRIAGAAQGDQLAVAISGSQKTLMIGLDVALGLGAAGAGLGGIVILPMVAYHVAQLVIDTLLVDWLGDEG